MTDERIAEAERRLKKLTPGPWIIQEQPNIYDPEYDSGRDTAVFAISEDRKWKVAEIARTWTIDGDDANVDSIANAEFIANAPADLRDALAALCRVRAVKRFDVGWRDQIIDESPEGDFVRWSDLRAALDGLGLE